MKLSITFIGRKTGSIGIDHEIKTTLEINELLTVEQIKMKLYEDYEHIRLDERDIFIDGTNDYYKDLLK